MVKYICDRCGQEAHTEIAVPRKVKYSVMDNGKEISSFYKLETKNTHVCYECWQYIISLFDEYK